MTRTLYAVTLLFTAATANAANWPWQQAAPEIIAPQYCKGFVAGGLGSKLVAGASRTELWLGWGYVVDTGDAGLGVTSNEFQSGQAHFHDAADAAAAASVLQQADGSCGLGRSGHQITGW